MHNLLGALDELSVEWQVGRHLTGWLKVTEGETRCAVGVEGQNSQAKVSTDVFGPRGKDVALTCDLVRPLGLTYRLWRVLEGGGLGDESALLGHSMSLYCLNV